MSISPEQLRTIARQAVSEHLSDGTDLTTSVVKAASAYGAFLTSEHVRRICEMTYHDAYERMYRENQGGQDRYVTFDPPDAAAAAHQLQAAKVASFSTRRTEMTQTTESVAKVASATPRRFDTKAASQRALASAFSASGGQEKIAWANPVREIMSLKNEMKEAVSSLEAQEASAGASAKYAMYDLLSRAEQECKEGSTVGEVLYACVTAANEKVAEAVLNPLVRNVADHLVRRGFNSALGEKTASYREVNSCHPLPQSFVNVATLREEQEKAAGALVELRDEYKHLCSRIANELGR